jgi:hypothetical protein
VPDAGGVVIRKVDRIPAIRAADGGIHRPVKILWVEVDVSYQEVFGGEVGGAVQGFEGVRGQAVAPIWSRLVVCKKGAECIL